MADRNIKKININDLIRVSKENEIRPIHIILGTRSQEKLGEINCVQVDTVNFNLQTNQELSFTVYKEIAGEQCNLWNEIINFRLIWVKEYDMWFEIYVDIDDSETTTKKTVTCTSLCEAELGQTNMDATEINTEDDPNWTEDEDEYIPTIFYNEEEEKYSLLHRVLKKVPNYSIKHVDSTLCKIQRTFSIANTTSVYDCLVSTIAQEIGCLFLFDTNERGIYVYDLETTCLECGKRHEEDVKVCPDCGSKNLSYPYGSNTTIYIDKENLGQSLQVTLDTASVKNCFKVQGGDDNVDAAIRNVNPNGSNYLYILSEESRKDMPDELVKKFDDYYTLVDEYNNTKEFTYTSGAVSAYNAVINKVRNIYADNIAKDDDFFPYKTIETKYIGYSNIPKIYYDTIDLKLYLHDSMMPTYVQAEESAEQQLAILKNDLSPVSLEKWKNATSASAESAVKVYARALMDTSRFKITVKTTSFTKYSGETGRWTGDITVENYSDEDDNATYTGFSVTINADYPSYIRQMVEKLIAKVDTQGVKDIFDDELSLDDFKKQLKYYCYASLDGFYNAYQTCLDLFVEANISDENSGLYDTFYLPYFNRFKAIESEMAVRSTDIEAIDTIQAETITIMDNCEKELDFANYLGDELYHIFLNYRREDIYKNENYVSDGLTNYELIDKANELLDVAKKELRKSNNRQYTVSGNITNLLLIKDDNGVRPFASWLDDFSLGNYIHTKIDGTVYNMRLANISMNYDAPESLTATFYDITKDGASVVGETNKLLTSVKTMGSTYNSTKKQAQEGMSASEAFNKLQQEGLNSAQYNIYNEDVTVSIDEHGVLCRIYDDILEEYKPNQARLGAYGLIFTKNGWETTTTALGRQSFTFNGTTYDDYGLNANFVISGMIIAGDIYSADFTTDSKGKVTKGTHIDLNDGTFDFAAGKLSYNGSDLTINGTMVGGAIKSTNYVSGTRGTYIDLNGGSFQFGGDALVYNASNDILTLNNGTIKASSFTGGHIYSNTTGVTHINLNNGEFTFASGKLKYENNKLSVSGEITASSGTIGGWTINGSSLTSSSSLYYGRTTLSSTGTITCNNLIVKNQGTIGNFAINSDGLSGGILKYNGTNLFNTRATSPFGGNAVTQIENICVNQISALNLSATYATISSLNAATANLEELIAEKAYISDITVDNLSVGGSGHTEWVGWRSLPSFLSRCYEKVITDKNGNNVCVVATNGPYSPGSIWILQGYD